MILKVIFFLLVSFPLVAQQAITIDDFTHKNTFAAKNIASIRWMKDGKSYSLLQNNKIITYAVETGQPLQTIVDGAKLTPTLTIQEYSFSEDERKILITTNIEKIYRRSFVADYYVYDITRAVLSKISDKGKQSYVTFSPDGSKAAFVRDNNLFYVDLNSKSETQVTDDGRPNYIINGSTDWVYEEEWSFTKAFYWSPDSKRLAYIRFDESDVKEYTLQKWSASKPYPENFKYKYPKAGEANSVVEVWIYELTSRKKVRADIGEEKDIYIPRVQWTNDPMLLSVFRMNRLQNEVTLLHINASTGESNRILEEESSSYVDLEYTDELAYLDDGKHFIHSSERSGYKHLYLYRMDGTLVNPITSGSWEVVSLTCIDQKNNRLYYISTEDSHLERQLYSISLDGKRKTKLSKAQGVHAINMSRDCKYYIDHFTNATEPLTITLHHASDGKQIRIMEENSPLKSTIQKHGVVAKEFFTYTAADGVTLLDGYMIKPAQLQAGKKYPALLFQYSGPRAPSVLNNFEGSAYFYWFQMLAQQGIIVAVVDTRGAGYRGEQFTKQVHKQLGKLELEDIGAAAQFLKTIEYIDGSRLGIFGWSYGGYIASLAMTKSAGIFKIGIAGAPVTSWRFYDNIYTERYLQRPNDNPTGYDDNSPVTFAGNLQGKLLLIHGTGDDNVHIQNSMIFEDALIKAGKQFQTFYYPDEPHGIRGATRRHHLFTLMTNFIKENL